MESAAGFFRQLEATAGSDGGRRIFHQLDKFEGLCLSPIQHDIQIFDQNQEGSSRPDSCGTGLASATVVPSNNGTSMSTSSGHSPGVDNAFGSAGQLPPSSSSGITPVSRLVIIRDRFKARGFSDQLLVGGTVMPHQLATRVPGMVCSVGSLNGIKIPCLLLPQTSFSISLLICTGRVRLIGQLMFSDRCCHQL
jgi:hypothetical protein